MKKLQATFILLLATLILRSQDSTPFIVIDQFGYLPEAQKVAIIRDPQSGFDGWQQFQPGNTYELVNAQTGETAFTGEPILWNNGTTDPSSGDKVWWFDFSSVSTNGTYYVHDTENDVKSFEFSISQAVYNHVLKQAVRTFFYQRAGFAKEAPFAAQGWTDGASHMGAGQDANARLFNDMGNPDTERDLSGGWYDAGDYNKYTSWTASYVVEMALAYLERPEVWTDDYNLPESGNGVPDILDELKWGTDHLLRLQEEDGSVLSIVGLAHASPPSAASGPSKYGPANTSGTLNTAAALAVAAKAFRSIGNNDYADLLQEKAILAWQWADQNPNVLFQNNDSEYGSVGLGAGKQEVDDYGRLTAKIKAACYLFDITGESVYQEFFDDHYSQINMFQWNFAFPFQSDNQDIVLYYTTVENSTPSVVTQIRQVYGNAMNSGSENFPAINNQKDPYRAHLKDYTWGSNGVKARQGGMFYNMVQFGFEGANIENAENAALGYINYLHGTNPLNMVYLSNMYQFGAKNGVNEFYHSWFSNGSAKWDRAGVSTYGPAPGFLTGGPNPSYNWDNCCPSSCGSPANNAICISESIAPPKDQPAQKSYKDFNTSWPLNSWSVTENSNGYQLPYIRLLSKFVNPEYDCNGDLGGSAIIDVCGQCTGGNTGLTPETNPAECTIPYLNINSPSFSPFKIFPNPAEKTINIASPNELPYQIIIYDTQGKVVKDEVTSGESDIRIDEIAAGLITVLLINEQGIYTHKIIKQ